jgi:ATP-dependent RNA helicase HelY
MLVEHPVAECPDASRHLAASRRANRVRRRLEQHRALRRSSGFGLVEEFQAIRQLLEELGYTEGWSLTPRGERLRRIYNETDLLLAEAMERGFLYGLEPAELASLLSAFVYEPRSDQTSVAEWPTPELHARWSDIEMLWKDLTTREKGLRLSPTRRPDPGFGTLAYQWASEVAFDDLDAHGMAPGDFVRVSRQLADLLRQIRDGVSELREEAMTALISVDRGVVAAQGVG